MTFIAFLIFGFFLGACEKDRDWALPTVKTTIHKERLRQENSLPIPEVKSHPGAEYEDPSDVLPSPSVDTQSGRASEEAAIYELPLPFCDEVQGSRAQFVEPRSSVEEGQNIDPYGNITLDFTLQPGVGEASERLFDDVFSNIQLVDADGLTVPGKFYWRENKGKSIVFNPYGILQPGAQYRLKMAHCSDGQGEPKLSRTSFDRDIAPLNKPFYVLPSFSTSFKVNGIDSYHDYGMFLSAAEHPDIVLDIAIVDGQRLREVVLTKVGVDEPVKLCGEGTYPCEDSFHLDLSSWPSIAPSAGLNSYLVVLKDESGRFRQRLLDFSWGNFPSDPGLELDAATVFVGGGKPLVELSKLLSAFTSGDYLLGFKEQGTLVAKSLNDLLRQQTRESEMTCNNGEDISFRHLTMVGPFDDGGDGIIVNGSHGALAHFEVKSRVYMDSFRVAEETGNIRFIAKTLPASGDGGEDAVRRQQSLALDLYGKKLDGKLLVEIFVEKAVLGDGLGIPVGLTGKSFLLEVPISLNEVEPVAAHAYVTPRFYRQGQATPQVHLSINQNIDIKQAVNGDPDTAVYFDTADWVEKLKVKSEQIKLVGCDYGKDGLMIRQMIIEILKAQIKLMKPQIMNLAIKDMVEKLSPHILNNLLSQANSGVTIGMPDFLPAPIKNLGIGVAARLGSLEVLKGAGIVADFKTSLMVGAKGGIPLASLQGPLSSYPNPANFPLYFPDYSGDVDLSKVGADDIVANINPDLLNQALFQFWKQGALNMTLDRKTYEKMLYDPDTGEGLIDISGVTLAGGGDLEQLVSSLFEARAFVDMLNLDFHQQKSFYPDGSPLVLGSDSGVAYKLETTQPPLLQLIPATQRRQAEAPSLQLSIGGVRLHVQSEGEGGSFVLGSLKMALSAAVELKIGKNTGPLKNMKYAMKLTIDPASVSLGVEAFDYPGLNVFGFDSDKVAAKISDLGKNTLVPLVQEVVKNIPIPDLEMCGVRIPLGQAGIFSVLASGGDSALQMKLPVEFSEFSGICGIEPGAEVKPIAAVTIAELPKSPGFPTGGLAGFNQTTCDKVKSPAPRSQDYCRVRPKAAVSLTEVEIPPGKPTGIGAPWDLLDYSGVMAPGVDASCRMELFSRDSCSASYVYWNADESYRHTLVHLYAALPKDRFTLATGEAGKISITDNFLDFGRWVEYASHVPSLDISKSVALDDLVVEGRSYKQQYSSYKVDSPIGYLPIRVVTRYRILPEPFAG